MRQLGLDVGDKRIGIALSDETAPWRAGFRRTNGSAPKKDLQALAKLVKDHGVEQVVVGFPET